MDSYETEWQFEAEDLERVQRWLLGQPASASLTFTETKDSLLHDTYFETEGWDVHRAKFGLRLRRTGDRAVATLKALGAPADGPRVRREISQELEEGATDITGTGGPVLQRVRLLAGNQDLVRLFDIDTRRRVFIAKEDGEPVAELALDDSSIQYQGQVVKNLKRVEVECIGNSAQSALLQSFVTALSEELALQPALASKYESGLAAAGLQPEPPLSFEKAETPLPDDAANYALEVLRRNFIELVIHESGTRLGEDPEELHDMRVALRRIRAALSMFRAVLPTDLVDLRDELKWLGQVLGAVRDLDVQMDSLKSRRAGSSWEESNAIGELLTVIQTSWTDARAQLVEVLDSERYRLLLLRFEAILSADPASMSSGVPVRELVGPILEQRYKAFTDAAEELTPESEPGAFHAVRVLGKRLRYSIEFSRAIYGKPASRLVNAVTNIQDLLGEHQDSSVAIDRIRNIARDPERSLAPRTLLHMGELIADHRARMQDLRSQWPSAFQKLRKPWRSLRKEIEGAEQTEKESLDAVSEEVATSSVESSHSRNPLALWRRGP